MFTLRHPEDLKAIIQSVHQVHGPSEYLILDFPHDSIAWTWLREHWSEVNRSRECRCI